MASSFPFTLTAEAPNLSPTTANAIDAHLMEILSIRQPGAADGQGNVLAVVTFPKDDGSNSACDGKPWLDIQLRMSYEKLMGLGSKKIRDMFNPRAQTRFRRRLGLEQLPPGIEYVVDFTPPSEGPELADLTAALWLPRIVKLWFLAGRYLPDPVLENGLGAPTRPLADKAVGAILALGHDDVCKGLGCLTDYAEWQPKAGLQGIVEDNPAWRPGFIPSWRKVEDYCPIRHRVSIVRLLKAINGDNLLLNSAVRLWTVAQVAISLEIPQAVVDPVTQWLVAPPNTKFIEICPERAFQLAYALKIPSVLIAAFKILVNELAIDYASSNPVPGRPPLTWAQRRRDDYGDYPSDPIEYASRAFAERMSRKLRVLQSHEVFNLLPSEIPEWDKLQSYSPVMSTLAPGTALPTTHRNLVDALLSAFHDWVDKALGLEHFSGHPLGRLEDLLEAQRSHYIPSGDRKPLLGLYRALNPAQKILTPFFWDKLNWTESRHDFAASVYLGQPLSHHIDEFNAELRRALVEGTISPDPSNPTATDLLSRLALAHPSPDFNLDDFHYLLSAAVRRVCSDVLGRARDAESGIPFFLSDHLLLSLDENELNYLPIWADGLDDGSGGVFQEAIPPAEMGPSEPGPGYHTGYTTAGTGAATETDARTVTTGYGGGGEGRFAASSIAPSDLGMGDLALASETAGRSLQVQGGGAGLSVTEGRVLSLATASASESFTADDESAYADARFAQPAAHQAQGQAIERYMNEAEDGEGGVSGGPGGGDEMDLDSDEELDFGSDDGSSTLDGFEELDFEEAG